jgi:hypothetical protein
MATDAPPSVADARLRAPVVTPFTPRVGLEVATHALVPLELRNCPCATEDGHVAEDHAGVVLAPDWSICPAVAVPARIAPADVLE